MRASGTNPGTVEKKARIRTEVKLGQLLRARSRGFGLSARPLEDSGIEPGGHQCPKLLALTDEVLPELASAD